MRGKILIVEDYQDWRELLSGMLQREGLDITTASTLQKQGKYSRGRKIWTLRF